MFDFLGDLARGAGKIVGVAVGSVVGATRNNTIYPSLDPSIFEVRYPNTDIQGRVVSF